MFKRKETLRIYFFILLVIITTSCEKEKPISETLIGKWYVERVTKYDEHFANMPTEVKANYNGVGTFIFRSDGTGVYIFVDSVDFQYELSDDVCKFTFDQNDILDQSSPILFYYLYGADPVSTYKIFSENSGTANFYHHVQGYSSTDSFRKVEFLLTKIE